MGNDPKWRCLPCQVVQVIQHPDQKRAASLVAEDIGAVRLSVGMQADAWMARLGTGVAIGHHDDLVAEQRPQKADRRGMDD